MTRKKHFSFGEMATNALSVAVIVVLLQSFVDWLKTDDQRKYHDQVDLEFERSRSAQQLLPILYDDKQPAIVRAELLVRLMGTRSISDDGALLVTDRLVGKTSNQISDSNQDAYALLLKTWVQRFPQSLKSVMEFLGSAPFRKYAPEKSSKGTTLWNYVFLQGVERATDQDLALLNDDGFIGRYLTTMEQLLEDGDDLNPHEHQTWFARPVKGLRILAAIQSLRTMPTNDAKHQEENYLLDIIDPKQQTPANINLSGLLINMLTVEELFSPAIAERCVQILARPHDFYDADHPSVASGNGSYTAAYLTIYTENNDGVHGPNEDLQNIIVPILKEKFTQIAGATDEDLLTDLKYQFTIGAIRQLTTDLVVDLEHHHASTETTNLLRYIEAMPDSRLSALELLSRTQIEEVLKK